MSFSPIAIVGRSCILPGALSPEELWASVSTGKDLISECPPERWRVPVSDIVSRSPEDRDDRASTNKGGYVSGFERIWKPDGFGISENELEGLDPLFKWSLHCAREALRDAGDHRVGEVDRARVGAVIGNLGFPSSGMTQYAESVWMGERGSEPRNRFMSGGLPDIISRALGLDPNGICLDTACASSLYAIKLACDQLNDGKLDMALAGAVNRSDDLFIHVGFSALKALSPSGQSRPFHADANGLVPAEGAGIVALKRLEDAKRDGNTIYGVIRGVGLSNDGRGRGFLAPSEVGQQRALNQAYQNSGIEPKQVSLLECHATGTILGDSTEIRSTAKVFSGCTNVPIGSLKSNMGHLITTAGVAALIKVLEAIRHGQRPPTLHVQEPAKALRDTPFRLLQKCEPWECSGPKIAGISAFGFGGNNAHLLVSEDTTELKGGSPHPIESQTLALVSAGAIVGETVGTAEFKQALLSGKSFIKSNLEGQRGAKALPIRLGLKGLRFPPKDLNDTLGQQLLILKAAREAVDSFELPKEKTGVFMAMEPDTEVCRYGLRWRLGQKLKANNALQIDQSVGLAALKDQIVPVLGSAGVVGTMPNIPANRLNSQFDFGGASVSLSAGERSGTEALKLAVRALSSHEIDAALVCAVDLSCQPIHVKALEQIEGKASEPGDAAVALLLKRLCDAERDGDAVLCTLEQNPTDRGKVQGSRDAILGRCWAAGDLRDLLASALTIEDAPIEHQVHGCTFLLTRGATTTINTRKIEGPSAIFNAHPPAVSLSTNQIDMPSSTFLEIPMQKMPPAPSMPSVVVEPNYQSAHIPAQEVRPIGSNADKSTASDSIAYARENSSHVENKKIHPNLLAAQAEIQTMGEGLKAQLQRQMKVHQGFVNLQNKILDNLRHLRSDEMHLSTSGAGIPSSIQGEPVYRPAVKTEEKPSKFNLPKANSKAVNNIEKPQKTVNKGQPIAQAESVQTLKSSPKETFSKAKKLPRSPNGPSFDKLALNIHASGQISEIFGSEFEIQDSYHRQVRMPEPPLLLADRITGLDAQAGVLGEGTIWSETDVKKEAWYLHQGHMPAGIMIESGQADLMLISYMGVDFSNRGERVYRLLGCELTYHGGLPSVGDTLSYDIHMDGHATQGDVRLMFFHYNCQVNGQDRLTVQKGQAGFFTDAELAESDGCLWTPEAQNLSEDTRVDKPYARCEKQNFTLDEVRAFADGRPWDCFGDGFEMTKPHTRSPRIQNGQMLLIGDVQDFNPNGGPWGRGYLKSTVDIDPSLWFFDGHFKNDSCMPGTLMFEGCLQAMAFYLAGMGYTINRDGWRFEPVPEMPFALKCRGQVTPSSKKLIYEVFVEEVHEGPVPTLYADLLCTVDGLKAFHARRVAIQLIPAWPLDEGNALLEGYEEAKPVAKAGEFPFDYRAMLACANGKPSEAFGPIYSRFDGTGRVARLPNPPYHFLSRVTRTSGEIGSMSDGMEVDVEYDIPSNVWYFDENGCRTMPFAVLLEAALQPCGWLASYMGCALSVEKELCFRNLDGTCKWMADILPESGTLLTRVKSTRTSRTASMIIVSFDVECLINDTVVFVMDTVFGFFPEEALANQIGLPVSDEQRAFFESPSTDTVDLCMRPTAYWRKDRPQLAEPMLLMLDRVTLFEPTGGSAGLGRARGEKDVDPGEWFFKAHFFQDPVQPGSLGIEAMIQLLQWTMLELGLDSEIENPRFEPMAFNEAMTWKYRGQVVPKNKLISSTLEITEIRKEAGSVLVLASASLWVDGKRIYEASNLGVRIVSTPVGSKLNQILDPEKDHWIKDHCPTWTVPALPMMSMVDLMAQGACTADPLIELKDIRVKSWLTFDGARTLRTERRGENIRLLSIDEKGVASEVASAKAITGAYPNRPKAMSRLEGDAKTLPYETGALFHGPAFQCLSNLVQTKEGASSILRAEGSIPLGRLNPMLLDGATHGIPHDCLGMWDKQFSNDKVAYPALITSMTFYGPTPSKGELRCEVRPDGCLGGPDFPAFQVQLIGSDGLWCAFRLVEAAFPKGAIGNANPQDRRAYLKDRQFISGLRLSQFQNEQSELSENNLKEVSWLPGTIKSLFGTTDLEVIARKEHISAAHHIHPTFLPHALPLTQVTLDSKPIKDGVCISGEGRGTLDLSTVKSFWSSWFNRGPWPVEDLYYGLCQRFIGRVVLSDPESFTALHGRSMLFLGNHQVGVESLLFSIIASAITSVPTVTLAKIEHKKTWLGQLIEHCFNYPEVVDPKVISFFDRKDKSSLPKILGEFAKEMKDDGRSVMVHVEGTRSLDCTQPVQKMSGAFIDMAIKAGVPVVPVRFVGGLPRERMDNRIEFPIGMGKQDIYFGRPIMPNELAELHYGARKERVINSINSLGPSHQVETPYSKDVEFETQVRAWMQAHDVGEEHAVLGCVLSELEAPGDEVKALLKAAGKEALTSHPNAEWLMELSQRLFGRDSAAG